MTRRKMLQAATALAIVSGLAFTPQTRLVAQGKTSVQIFIPRKVRQGAKPTNADFPQIGVVKANISVNSNSAVAFTIIDPNNVSQSFSPIIPGGSQQTITFASGDTVLLSPSSDGGNPNQYQIQFVLRSGSLPNCTGAQAQDRNVYTVSARSTDPRITDVCLDSYDGRYRSVPVNVCSNGALGQNLIPVPLDNPADTVASLDPSSQPTQRCTSFAAAPPRANLRLAPRNLQVRPH